MLIDGDLVRVPQSSILYSADDESFRLHVMEKPDYGIVLGMEKDKVKVLIRGDVWFAKQKDIRLVGDKNVHKIV